MKRSLLTRLRANGTLYIFSALILLIGIPCYQLFILGPTGFNDVTGQSGSGRIATYLLWIHNHNSAFLLYRALLISAFALLWTLPFSLYRIIVAQELMGQQERAAEESSDETEDENNENTEPTESQEASTDPEEGLKMPEFAWRGKGFVVIAVWTGIIGLAVYLLSTIAGTLYLNIAGSSYIGGDSSQATEWAGIFTLGTNAVAIGLIGLSTLFFGAMICRTGLNLWPTNWVIFGYAGLLCGALLCISAVAVACTPGTAQSTLTTAATLLFAIWVGWLGIILRRLKAEA